MPIVANTGLPSFERFRLEGGDVLSRDRAVSQDIRELHIGLMNNMPDAAMAATERQFLRLIGGCNRIAQFYVYPFSPPHIKRGSDAKRHIEKYYYDFDQLKLDGLDALIVSGANPVCAELPDESFWEPMVETLDWAIEHVTSTLCACLATHAAFLHLHKVSRRPLSEKRWGVFPNRVVADHPLVRNINSRFDVPHSRWNDISAIDMRSVGQQVLVESEEAGVHLATSADGLRLIFFQGHPEYDNFSLLKEYKREVNRFLAGEVDRYPPFPTHYFMPEMIPVLDQYRADAEEARRLGIDVREFPESDILVDNTWGDTGKIVFNNWLGTIYQLTNPDRRKPFMDGIDPKNPLARIF